MGVRSQSDFGFSAFGLLENLSQGNSLFETKLPPTVQPMIDHRHSRSFLTNPAVWTFPKPHNNFISRYIISGRSGLNHGGVANDVCRNALAEGLGLDLFAQECYQVLAGVNSEIICE
jgi:hypothetical protein